MMQPYRRIKKLAGLLAVASLLIIFKGGAISFADKLIIPFTSKVETGSFAVLLFIILFVIAVYLANGILIYKKNYVKRPDNTFYLASVALVFYFLFRFNDHFVFYAVGQAVYVDVAFVTVAILEALSYFCPKNKTNGLKGDANVAGFLSDNPSRTDKLERTDYAELLLDKICETFKAGSLEDGSMTILLNERYGAGKTTFFNILENKAKGRIRTCVFKPWQTSDGGRITEELLKILEEQYAISSELRSQLEGYSKLLSGSEVRNVLDFVSHLLKDSDSLVQRYKSIKEMLQIINDPLVVFVDDVDRLQAEELLALLKLLRNAADFPNIIYLVAADKEAMSLMLEIEGIKDADEYLKKFFNIELLFPIDDSYLSTLLWEQIVNTLSNYCWGRNSVPSIEKEFLTAHYLQNVFHSPRDIYRFVNLLSFTLDLFKRYGMLEEVHMSDLLKLLLIQFVSPIAYKILRDEMDLLLVVRAYDGRIHLKDGYKDIIMSRQNKKLLQDVLAQAKQDKTGNLDKFDDNEKVVLSLFDIPAEERPNKEDILCDLLRDLFYDTQNYQDKSRICYSGEYFKFFAGKYSRNELSSQYMKELMEQPSETTFEETIHQVIKQGKTEFLIHKLKHYIEDKKITKDIPFVLNRCLIIQDAIYQDWSHKQSIAISPLDFNKEGKFQFVYSNLLLVDKKDVVTNIKEFERVKALYSVSKQYTWLASSLNLPLSEDRDFSFVYGQKQLHQLQENLIRRFIVEELADTPFKKEKIQAIPVLRSMYHVCWEEHFREYVRNSPEPQAWLYILLKPSGDILEWNYVYYHNLVDGRVLDCYAKESLGLELTQELETDLAQISGAVYGAAITAANFEHHLFFVEAKKWWDAQKQ